MENQKKTICVVIPTYNEEDNIQLAYDTLCKIFAEQLQGYRMRIVFADNFSTDTTRQKIRALCVRDSRVGAILNATNVGYARSSYYAMTHAGGDAVVLLSADLQEPPEMIPAFVKRWEEGAKVVCGVKCRSRESRLMYFIRQRYYDFLRTSSEINHINQFNGFALYDSSFIGVLKQIEDPLPYLRGIVAELAPCVSLVEYTQNRRQNGKTHYKFWGLYDFAMHGITSSTKGLLRLATVAGFCLAACCVVIALTTLVMKLIRWNDFQVGVASLTTGLFFIGAVMLFYIGLIGEYISNINMRVMHHPLVVEEERINLPSIREEETR